MRFVGIDPSTKTGFVALDEQGKVLRAKEITGAGSKDPYRMRTMIEDLMCHIHPCDLICIEGVRICLTTSYTEWWNWLGYSNGT